jgi:hypothetical protein
MRLFIYLLLVLLKANICLAQDEYIEETKEAASFGIKAGINYTNIYQCSTKDFNTQGKAGFAGGIFVSIPICKYVGLQPELLFSQRGFKATGNYWGSEYELNRTLNYIDVPLLASFNPVSGLSILFGPQYSYLLNQHDSFTNSVLTVAQEDDFKNDKIRKGIFCLTGGLDFNLNNTVLGLRAGWDLINNKDDETFETPQYKNVWIQGTLGFRI